MQVGTISSALSVKADRDAVHLTLSLGFFLLFDIEHFFYTEAWSDNSDPWTRCSLMRQWTEVR